MTETLYSVYSNSPFPPPPALATTIVLPVSMTLTTLGISYMWTHVVFVLLRLAYFTSPNVLKFHPCCSL